MKTHFDVVVLGCGIIGLAIANELVEKGYRVAVVGAELPEDVHSTAFASSWAGAVWYSFATTEAERRRDELTFDQFAKLAAKHPHLVAGRRLNCYWQEAGVWKEPWFRSLVSGGVTLPPDAIPEPFKQGVTFKTYTVNPPLYIHHLASNLRARNVPILRTRLSSLDEAYTIPKFGHVALVINATGLGARSLMGAQDADVYPGRGQTVLVRAPWVKEAHVDAAPLESTGISAYVLPRPGPDGHVVLGGTYTPDEWSTSPEPVVAENILKACHILCPQLDGKDGKGTWQDIDVLSHNVGLRPMRKDGLRLELETRHIGQGVNDGLQTKRGKVGAGREVEVVHAYDIGGSGYQASLGIAAEASSLVRQWFEKNRKARL
ncbi:hypothetical protein L202_07362 [Cryptococcus amylolentus CBS 6039]|uniref:FAD dependent oxidoreductase domain-containing protein n=1 Tax=Cryptococcus amylolentus CBS 6039 TaxID=1295533 RepID=A0A1E3HBW4_9TREE|nr:hypothetical protein L202_07362 [Cryptococcus amylolentus CBS 6039]ODN73838.1 hypothetical protein L202_07362 [Cryptococcus amylolentus CBS 6039]